MICGLSYGSRQSSEVRAGRLVVGVLFLLQGSCGSSLWWWGLVPGLRRALLLLRPVWVISARWLLAMVRVADAASGDRGRVQAKLEDGRVVSVQLGPASP